MNIISILNKISQIIIIKTLLLFIVSIYANQLLAQNLIWQNTGGPMGGIVGGMDINSKGDIYAGVYPFEIFYTGLFKSTNNGDSWNKIETQFEDFEVFTIYITDNDDIFVGTGNLGRIYRSTDNGQTWENKSNGFFTGECWAFGESKDGVLFAGDANFGFLYRSTNNGDSWEFSTNIEPLAFATDSNNVIYAGTFNGLYKSYDNGINWQQDSFLTAYPISSVIVDSENNIYCGTGYSFFSGNGVYFSEDGGQSWIQIGLSGLSILALDLDSEERLYTGTLSDGLFKTTDNGENWIQYNEGLYGKEIFRLTINEFDDIFVGSEGGGEGFGLYKGGGIFRSTNSGNLFEQVGLPISFVSNLELDGDSLIYAATPSGVQVFNRKTQKWKNIGLHNVEAVSVPFPGFIWAGTMSEGLFYSTDSGEQWNSIDFNLGSINSVYNILALDDVTIFAATDLNLTRSINGGITWDTLSINTGYTSRGLFFKDDILFAVGSQPGNRSLFKSTDLGNNFEMIHNDLSSLESNSPITYTNNGYIYIADRENPTGILRSTNNGMNWGQIFSKPAVTIFSSSNDLLITGSDSIYLSYNYGNDWIGISQPFKPGIYVNDIKQDGTKFFFGTSGQGIYEADIITDVQDENQNIQSFSLEQNYPNPFNPNTKIGYSIPDYSFVSLKVYDILSREVATLVNEEKKSGVYEVEFDASNLASGFYIYRIQIGDFLASKKMLLVK